MPGAGDTLVVRCLESAVVTLWCSGAPAGVLVELWTNCPVAAVTLSAGGKPGSAAPWPWHAVEAVPSGSKYYAALKPVCEGAWRRAARAG